MKIFIFPLWLWALLAAAAAYSQPVKVPVVSTQLKEPADISVVLSTKKLVLAPIYLLFTESASGCQPGACAALPLTLLSFDGKRLNPNLVMLTWKTTNEVNTAGFDVQRSLGNQTQFEKIAFVPAMPGNLLIKKYELPDANSFAGTSWYRLKQLDIDSQFVYSKIIAIKNTGQQESLTLYPNPASSLLNLDMVVTNSATAHIILCDAQGKILMQQSPFIQQGTNFRQLNISSLAAGTYFIRMYTGSGTNLVGSFLKN